MMANTASLVNSIFADDGFRGLSDDTKSKVKEYLRNPNTSYDTRTQPKINFNKLKHGTNICEARFLDFQKEIDAVNEQFKKSLTQRQNLMLHNETLLKNVHEAELKEKMTKVDNGILKQKIETLTESLFKCKNEFSKLHSKYNKEINEFKPDLIQKESEVLVLKNDVNLLQIQSKNQENTIKLMNREIEDLNHIHLNEIQQIKNESTNNQRFKECYKNELEKTKRLTIDIIESRDNVNKLTSSLNDVEKKFSILSNDHQQYRIATEHTLSVLKNQLNASEEIVKQLLPGNSDNPNNLIQKGTTITDVYVIYQETYLKLQDTTLELEKSKTNFNILEEEIRNTAPMVDKMEKDLTESKEKINQLYESNSNLKLMLTDVNNKLKLSNTKYDELSKMNNKLQGSADDMSKQICFLLRNKQNNTRFTNQNTGMDMNPQSIISNNYVTFENIQGLQKQNKKLLEMLRSLCKANDEEDIKLIKDFKEKIQNLEHKLETQEQLISQQKEKITEMQSIEFKSELEKTQINDDKHNKVQTFDKTTLENDDNAVSCQLEKHGEYLSVVHKLNTANFTINQLKEQLESNSVTRKQLDHHVQKLDCQINELLGKIKSSDIKHTENVENVDNLQSKISSLEKENQEMKIEINKVESQCNILKKENKSMFISNTNYDRKIQQITELQKEFEKTLTSQFNSIILNWNLILTYIAKKDYDKVKFNKDQHKLTKILEDVRNTLFFKLEAINDLCTSKETSRSKTDSFSLCTDEQSNFKRAVSKLEDKINNLISKLNESDELKNQLKSELNRITTLNKSLEQSFKKMCEHSSQLKNECEIKNKEYIEKDQQLNHAIQELNKLNLPEHDNTIKLQNQLLEYELKYSTLLEELEKAKEHRDQLLNNIAKQYNSISTLQKELKISVHEKDQLEKSLNHRLAYYSNKLEVLDALELFNATKSTEIDDLKNQKAAMEKSTKEITELHKLQLNQLNDEINGLKNTIKRMHFENECLSEQLNSSKKSDQGDGLNNTSIEKVQLRLADHILESKLLDEENVILSSQLKEFQELDSKKTTEICALKEDILRMQNLVDQKTAEIVLLTNNLEKLKEQSNGTNSNAEYQLMLSTFEREKLELTTAHDELKSTKSKELCEKPEDDHSEEINKLKSKMVINSKFIETFKNTIKTYRRKLLDVASEINKVKVMARHFKHQNEELNNTLCTERSSWQNKFDEMQKARSKLSLDECKKLIEQGKQEQIAECEFIINEHKAKALEAEAGLNAAKIELQGVQVAKTKSEDKEMHAKQLLQQVKITIQNLTRDLNNTKKQRDGLLAQLDEVERGGRFGEIKDQISRIELDNLKLTSENDRLTHPTQILNQRLTSFMTPFSNLQGSESTLTVSNSIKTTAAQASPAISTDLMVLQSREQVQTTVSQLSTVSALTVSSSQSQNDKYNNQNENGQAMVISIKNIDSPSTKPEPSMVTTDSSGPSYFSLDNRAHSNHTQRKRKAPNDLACKYWFFYCI